MNERTFSWGLKDDAVQHLVSLNRSERIDFFLNLPIENVPIGSMMGFSKIEIDDKGQVSFSVTPSGYHYNPLGTVHGGLAATILDSCNSISANCQLDSGYLTMTADIRVNYLRPMSESTGEVTAKGKIVKAGRKAIFVYGEIKDRDGKIYATASSTELVISATNN